MMYKLRYNLLLVRTRLFELINRGSWKPMLKASVPSSIQHRLREKHVSYLAEFPSVFSIETTNHCNAKCWFCGTTQSNRKKGYMDYHLFKKIVDELQLMSKRIKSIALFMDGEPTMHPDLIDFLKYAAQSGLGKAYLSSNMELFTPELTDNIFDANLGTTLQYIICSLDGATEAIHRKTRVGVDFERAINNTLYLIDQRKKRKSLYPMIFLRQLVSDVNANQVEEFKRLWKGKADKALSYGMHNWGGLIKSKPLRLTEKDLEFSPCYFPFSQCAIQFDGTVRLCCLDCNCSTVIGNIQEDTIGNIWKNAKIEYIRKSHIEREPGQLPDICKNCSYPKKGTWVAPYYWH